MTDPLLQAALAGDAPFLFGAVEVAFPGYTLRLLDGAGELTIGGQLFRGIDDTFGTLDTIGVHEETIGNEAPQLEIGLLPPDSSAATQLASGLMQGSIVKIMMGAFDPISGLVIGTPEQLFLGEIDVPTYSIGANGERSVSYTVVSVFERLFEINEGERASDGWHQSIWPGEKGFEYVTGTVKNLYWMAKRPVPQYVQSGPGWNPTWGINPDLAASL